MNVMTAGIGTGAPGSEGRVLDFRRRPSPPRRRRRTLWQQLLRPFSVALLAVGLPVALAAWVLTAPQFGLREVAVEGAGRVSERWIRFALAPLLGQNLVRLPLALVEQRLARHPWVAAVTIEKDLPDRLRVALTERRPVALLEAGSSLVWADASGKAIAPVAPGDKTAGWLVVQLAGGDTAGLSRALGVAQELGRANPDWSGSLTRVDVLGEEDFRLHTRALNFPLLVRSGHVVSKVNRLKELLPELESRYPQIGPAIGQVDLRFERRIVVQPAASSSGLAPEAGPRSSLIE